MQFQLAFSFAYVSGHFFTWKVITKPKSSWLSRHTFTDLRKSLLKACLLFQTSAIKDIAFPYKPCLAD